MGQCLFKGACVTNTSDNTPTPDIHSLRTITPVFISPVTMSAAASSTFSIKVDEDWVGELSVNFNASAVDDMAITSLPRPTKITKHSKPTEELATRTGKSLTSEVDSELLDLNQAPPAVVLKRFPCCRLRYPARKDMTFWLLKDVTFPSSLPKALQQTCMYNPLQGDVFLWVHEKAQKDDEDDRMILPSGNTVSFVIVQRDGTLRGITAEVYTMQGQRNKGARRTGWMILKDIKYANELG